MTKYFKAEYQGKCLLRTSKADYQYAVIFSNLSWDTDNMGASFHKTLKNAEASAKSFTKTTYLKVLAVVQVTEISKAEHKELKK